MLAFLKDAFNVCWSSCADKQLSAHLFFAAFFIFDAFWPDAFWWYIQCHSGYAAFCLCCIQYAFLALLHILTAAFARACAFVCSQNRECNASWHFKVFLGRCIPKLQHFVAFICIITALWKHMHSIAFMVACICVHFFKTAFHTTCILWI